MSRLNTFFGLFDNSGFPAETGVETLFPFVLDMETTAGRKGFDVGMAARFRILLWSVTGSVRRGSDVDTLDTTQAAIGISDELEFAASGVLPPDSPGILNGKLQIQGSGTWADFDVVNALGTWIQHTEDGDIGVVPFRFQGFGPISLVDFDTVKDFVHVENIGSVTIRVPAWGSNPAGYHSLTTPIWADSSSYVANFLIEPLASLEYSDEDDNAIWGPDGTALLDPVNP